MNWMSTTHQLGTWLGTDFFCPERVAVMLEGNIIINLPTLADAFIILFMLMCALHLNYPNEMVNKYDFTQKVLMGLGDGKWRSRVLSIKYEQTME